MHIKRTWTCHFHTRESLKNNWQTFRTKDHKWRSNSLANTNTHRWQRRPSLSLHWLSLIQGFIVRFIFFFLASWSTMIVRGRNGTEEIHADIVSTTKRKNKREFFSGDDRVDYSSASIITRNLLVERESSSLFFSLFHYFSLPRSEWTPTTETITFCKLLPVRPTIVGTIRLRWPISSRVATAIN